MRIKGRSGKKIIRLLSLVGFIYGFWLVGASLYDTIVTSNLSQLNIAELPNSQLIQESVYSGSSTKSLVSEHCSPEPFSKIHDHALKEFPDSRIIRSTDSTIVIIKEVTNPMVGLLSIIYGFTPPRVIFEAIDSNSDGCSVRYYLTYQLGKF